MKIIPARWMFVTLFALSGFTGLIYESIWTHYLKLFLGHAAYAQSLVLAIFMGGMAIGAWWISRTTGRWVNLVRCYALVEAIIGLAALGFHEIFTGFLDFSLDTAIPALADPLMIELYRWGTAALLILPQSILLGMTFPLMAGGIIRRFPQESGRDLALLYFSNSLGAALGALASGFWLIAWVGLPGTIRLAGVINLLLAVAVAWLARAPEPSPRPATATPEDAKGAVVRILVAGAFFTGAASFIYEIAWIRMLSLVLGTTFHSFELMLSAFITGLALGGLWIRKRIDHIKNPMAFLGFVQLAMATLAMATLTLYEHTHLWMAWMLERLGTSDTDYVLFNLGGHVIAFVIMLPATFCAGMTLPLFTHVLLRRGHGERSIGWIYSANTLGSITGVLFAVHIGLPWLGLKLLLGTGALVDLLLGVVLLRLARPTFVPLYSLCSLAATVVVAGVIHVVTLDPMKISLGVYARRDRDLDTFEIVYYRDGKTATISTYRSNKDSSLAIATNGKVEAGVLLDPSSGSSLDEITMVMAAGLPLALNPDARTVANIGFGSGLTTHALLAYPGLERVDTIEIEPAMIDAAKGFMNRVYLAYQDPRSHFHIEDAKTWFARTQRRFDIIISEPSNPWVSGVSSLFSAEFYRHIRSYLSADGLLVQWLNLYEFNDSLMAQVLSALGLHFTNYEIYATNSADILIVAPRNGIIPELEAEPFNIPSMRYELAHVGLAGPQDLEIRRIGSRKNLAPLFALLSNQPNSDYYPTLELEGPRARFKQESAVSLSSLNLAPVPIMEMIDAPAQWWHEHPVLTTPHHPRIAVIALAQGIRGSLLAGENLLDEEQLVGGDLLNEEQQQFISRLTEIIERAARCDWALPEYDESLHELAHYTLPFLTPAEQEELWLAPSWTCALAGPQIELQRAVALRSARDMLAIGVRELETARVDDVFWNQFAFLAALTGARALGREQELTELWDKYVSSLFPDGDFDPYVLLLAPR